MPPLQSHHNSQHVLAIYGSHPNADAILEEFGKTSALPCAIWSTSPRIVLASNYPDCIVESRQFGVLCAGFAYHYRTAFGGAEDKTTFAQTILECCEQQTSSSQGTSDLSNQIGRCLKGVSGHFSVYLVHKNSQQLWAWNDPFGFLPVYYCHNRNGSIVLSSHWDCLVPALDASTPELDWDVVAEYLIFGTTLGGINDNHPLLDRTFVQNIHNLSPGTCVHMETVSVNDGCPHMSRYIQCYGACEELLVPDETTVTSSDDATTPKPQLTLPPRRRRLFRGTPSFQDIPGIRLAVKRSPPPPPPKESSSILGHALWTELMDCFSDCLQQALQQGFVSRAALTGGGDTRLILTSLLLQQQPQPQPSIVFQTHSKQKTDWQIARHLAQLFRLPHERIQATSTTVEGHSRFALWNRQEQILFNLHDQTPLRRRQRRRRDRYKEHVVAYTLHGRFGTEFLGCLCFEKSPLDLRTREELDEFRPKATRWFQAMFGSNTAIRNPMDTLNHCFQKLEQDKETLEELVSDNSQRTLSLDVAYAFQLQLFTRAGLSDIYKGLRGGSWFSIPSAQFTRNAITPFLDNQLLQIMMCCVSPRDKEEPYQLYGRFYQAAVPDALLKVPSNNKLLCLHTEIPRAIKAPQATARPFQPKFIQKSKKPAALEAQFHPTFWKGATAIFTTAPVQMDPSTIAKDPRPEVQALVELVGGAEDACLLSGRLQSFLLWYERRLLPHLT